MTPKLAARFALALALAAPLALVAQEAAVEAAPTKTVYVPKGLDAAYDEWGYAPAVRVGDLVILSGIPAAGPGDYEAKVRRMYEGAKRLLAQAGATMEDVVELTSFHLGATDAASFQKEFETLSRVHAEYFPAFRPAWSAVGTTALLAPGAALEMRFVAIAGSGARVRVVRESAAAP